MPMHDPSRPSRAGKGGPQSEDGRDNAAADATTAGEARPMWAAEDDADGFEMADMTKDGRRVSDEDEMQAVAGAEEQDSEEEDDDDGALLAGRGTRRRPGERVPSFQLYTPDEEAQICSADSILKAFSSHSYPSFAITPTTHPLSWPSILRTLRDPKSYLAAVIFFFCNLSFSSMPVFLPSILHAMGSTPLRSQLLAAPPNLVAFATVLLTAHLSDRLRSRTIPLLIHSLLACTAYTALALALKFHLPHALQYLAVFPICAGFFSCVTMIITWTVNHNSHSTEGKSAGMAVLNVLGQMGPLVGTRLYPDDEGPEYTKGMAACAAAMGMVAFLTLVLRALIQREHRKMPEQSKMAGEEGEFNMT